MEEYTSYELLNKIDSPADLRQLPPSNYRKYVQNSGKKSLMNCRVIRVTLAQALE